MVIFHCYISSPEGIGKNKSHVPNHQPEYLYIGEIIWYPHHSCCDLTAFSQLIFLLLPQTKWWTHLTLLYWHLKSHDISLKSPFFPAKRLTSPDLPAELTPFFFVVNHARNDHDPRLPPLRVNPRRTKGRRSRDPGGERHLPAIGFKITTINHHYMVNDG